MSVNSVIGSVTRGPARADGGEAELPRRRGGHRRDPVCPPQLSWPPGGV